MPADLSLISRSRQDILDQQYAEFQTLIPDVYLGPDSNLAILLQVLAGADESVFLAIQLLSDDMFVATASSGALSRWGEQYGVFQKQGVEASGTLMWEGTGGAYVPPGAQAAYDPGTGEQVLYFISLEDGTIPDPGIPGSPTASIGIAGALSGLVEYGVTFETADGETAMGATSTPLTATGRVVNLTNLPIGGPGTTARRIYRNTDGSGYKFLIEISDNTTTTYADNNNEVLTGADAPTVSTAERIELAAAAEQPGSRYNLVTGAIKVVANAPDGIVAVENTTPFVGGTEIEAIDQFRRRLSNAVSNPNTGSVGDIKQWAEQVEGVESATVTPNYNLGVAANGHVTVWISGPNGTIPGADVIAAVEQAVTSNALANITVHVSSYNALSTDVTVTITLESGYTLAEVSPSVRDAIISYIYGLDVGETLRRNGIIDAVYGLTGVDDLTVNIPASNLTTGVTQKRVPGTIIVQ
jgi:uncharacterized phage protein gp47/JayE